LGKRYPAPLGYVLSAYLQFLRAMEKACMLNAWLVLALKSLMGYAFSENHGIAHSIASGHIPILWFWDTTFVKMA
jgi:hypothetical protein